MKKLRTFDIRDIEEEYKPAKDKRFITEDNSTYQIKQIMFSELTTTERRILILYAESKSLRKVGKILGVSTSKTFQVIKEIKDKIKRILNDRNNLERNPRV